MGVGTTDAVTVVRATRRAFGYQIRSVHIQCSPDDFKMLLTVRSSGLDGKAASRETIDSNVPVATIRIGDRDGGISGEGRVQVIPIHLISYCIQ